MMKRWLSMVVVVSLLAGAGARDVQADIIFDNLAKDQGTIPISNSSNWVAQKFELKQAYTLSTITLKMNVQSPGVAILSIFSNDGSQPGTSQVNLLSPNCDTIGDQNVVFNANSYLPANIYWAVLNELSTSNPAPFAWYATTDTSGVGSGFWANSADGPDGIGWNLHDDTPMRMEILGDSSAVPEPSTFIVFGGIMMGALAYRRKRKSRNGQEIG